MNEPERDLGLKTGLDACISRGGDEMSPTKVSSVRLEEKLLTEARKRGLNLSKILTRALEEELGYCTTGVLHSKHNAMLNDSPVEPVGETLTSTLAPQPCSLPACPLHLELSANHLNSIKLGSE